MSIGHEARDFYDANDDEALFRLARRTWPSSLEEEIPDGAAEVCRFAFIRAVEAGLTEQHLWRARSMTAAVIQGARDTAAGLLLQAFFVTTSQGQERTGAAARDAHEQARLVLDEMRRLIPEGTGPWEETFGRLYHEKRAYSFLVEALGDDDSAPGDAHLFDTAEREYGDAHSLATRSRRATLKVEGGLALLGYLRLRGLPANEVAVRKTPFLDATEAIRARAIELGYDDVVAWATMNIDVMRRGVFDGWTPYEVV